MDQYLDLRYCSCLSFLVQKVNRDPLGALLLTLAMLAGSGSVDASSMPLLFCAVHDHVSELLYSRKNMLDVAFCIAWRTVLVNT